MENNKDNYGEYLSLSSSGDEYQEHHGGRRDMANCLILLAQGQSREPPKLLQHQNHHVHHHQQRQQDSGVVYNKFNSRRFMEAASNGTGKAGYYVYECKTCNRRSPRSKPSAKQQQQPIRFMNARFVGRSLHRGKPWEAHEKTQRVHRLGSQSSGSRRRSLGTKFPFALKATIAAAAATTTETISFVFSAPALQQHNKPNKVHECSICGSEFTSGQALGGHMRHRGSIGTNITAANTALSLKVPTPMEQPQQPKKPKNVLSLDLDLNLPAPDDDHWEPKFPFALKQQQSQQQQQQQKQSALSSLPPLWWIVITRNKILLIL
ncbi:hypothetical protein F3Y22_tig00111881pilonHSYRG00001 [Hibiscus syriacus]|uniref:C2H2-type domain-containing protein n=1 Tax=Hibiscus syriacus TaxID=106335 RepID=A0A6A2XXS1_HIBSY|nr:hypothetical protein F3Y22_tig00111881pilonHSYRG00001 [Hibiscus syriacus]